LWLSAALLNSFEANDLRRTHWVGQGIDTVEDKFPYKYKLYRWNEPQQEYLMVLRLAEQYLILAEALANQQQVTQGLQYLNAVRHRAGLNDVTASSKEELVDLVLKERRVELFSEWGHRWFDLKRLNKINDVMQAAAPAKGAQWAPYKALFAIPYDDLVANGNLTQNQGYLSPR
jgi:hypothetical protein